MDWGSRRIQKYINLAIAEAELSPRRFKHGAVIFDKDLLSSGHNQAKTAPMPDCYHELAISHHAEQEAIRKARYTRGTTMVSVRVNNHGHFLMARPCKACMELIRDAGIRRVIYSTNTGWSIDRV